MHMLATGMFLCKVWIVWGIVRVVSLSKTRGGYVCKALESVTDEVKRETCLLITKGRRVRGSGEIIRCSGMMTH